MSGGGDSRPACVRGGCGKPTAHGASVCDDCWKEYAVRGLADAALRSDQWADVYPKKGKSK